MEFLNTNRTEAFALQAVSPKTPSNGKKSTMPDPASTEKEAFIWGLWHRLFPREAYPPFRSGFREDMLLLSGGILAGVLLGYLFFKVLPGLLLGIPVAYLALRVGRRKIGLRKREKLERELRDYLLSVISFLRAGYSLENAMRGAEKEILTMHGAESMMGREAMRMSRELNLKTPPERIWQSFAERSGSENGTQLARVFTIAKRQGGDYLPVLKASVRLMDARNELKREIHTLLAGQRLEYYIMCLVPAGMLLYLDISSPDMTRYLYEDAGHILMAGILLFYGLAVYWGDRILEKSYGE